MKKTSMISIIFVALMSLALSACQDNNNDALTASGHLSAIQVSISPEVNGRVVEIFVREGDPVENGDVLFRIDDEILQGQYEQAQAAADTADATLLAAQAQLEFAQTQYDLKTQSVRMQTMMPEAIQDFDPINDDFVPDWYFEKSEKIDAAQYELELAYQDLIEERKFLDNEIELVNNNEFVDIEQQYNNAQAGLLIATQVNNQALLTGDDNLIDVAQEQLDLAEAVFDTAKLRYDRLLNTSSAEDFILARSRVAVANERYDLAFIAFSELLTGEDSLEVSLVKANVKQAEAAVSQAESYVAEARAALKLIDLQIDRTEVKSPLDGTIMSLNIEAGEFAAAGGVLLTIAELDPLSLTVYVPADRYGQVSLGQKVDIRLDSFPSDVFSGHVEKIAEQAVYTPRNVQTADSRSSTVFAIKIHVPNPQLLLKPGMPADVTFIP